MTDYNEIPEVKSLQWIIFNFPFVENPEDNTDRLCNAINLYSRAAKTKIISLSKELDDKTRIPRKFRYIEHEGGTSPFMYKNDYKDLCEACRTVGNCIFPTMNIPDSSVIKNGEEYFPIMVVEDKEKLKNALKLLCDFCEIKIKEEPKTNER